jgi:hypothetical protein
MDGSDADVEKRRCRRFFASLSEPDERGVDLT